jgi:hypothetical protein
MSPLLTFRLLTGCRLSHMRAIGFLEGHKELDAGVAFDGFEGSSDGRYFRASMDQWLDGANGPKTRFHNFKSDIEFRECFVFKCDEHRLYGFLCHPMDTNSRFQLCALCIYAVKHERESDRAELKRVEEWRNNMGAQTAIAKVYPPKLKGRQSWKN